MKIRVTLEKADLIRLVVAHLETSGLNPVAGQDIKYKGALEVELLVEVGEPTRALAPSSRPPSPTGKDAADDGKSMEEVLAESARIQQELDQKEQLKRRLAPNESLEFPRGRS